MKVAELIEKLRTLPQDAVVVAPSGSERDAAFGILSEVESDDVMLAEAVLGDSGYLTASNAYYEAAARGRYTVKVVTL